MTRLTRINLVLLVAVGSLGAARADTWVRRSSTSWELKADTLIEYDSVIIKISRERGNYDDTFLVDFWGRPFSKPVRINFNWNPQAPMRWEVL